MASKRCPACRLVNPASAERCDCGRSFVDGSQGAALAIDRSHKDGEREFRLRPQGFGEWLLYVSLAFMLVGLAVMKFASMTWGGGIAIFGFVGVSVARFVVKLVPRD